MVSVEELRRELILLFEDQAMSGHSVATFTSKLNDFEACIRLKVINED